MVSRIALALTVIALAGAGAASWWLLRVGDLADQVVLEANLVMSAPRARPVHVGEASPGTLGQALAVHLPPLEKLARGFDDPSALQQLNEVNAGTRPLSGLPAAYAEALAQLGPDLDGLLAGTHAERAELAPADDPFMPAQGATWLSYQLAAKLTAVRVRRALAAGQGAEAASLCLDGLALGRDSAISGGLIGRMVRSAVTGFLLPACAAAGAAPGVERQEFVRRARAVRDAVPGLEAILREESAEMQLMRFGRLLSDTQRSRLLPRAAALVGTADVPAGPLERVLDRASWRPIAQAYQELTEAARLPSSRRTAALEAFRARWARSWNPGVVRFAESGTSFIRYGNGDDIAELRMDVVVCAALAKLHRERHGHWPARVDDLALEEAERDRLRGLSMSATGERLRIELTLPEFGELARTLGIEVAP